MKVYVISKNEKPLMPTTPARARKMLKNGKAEIYQRTPFTIKLTVTTKEHTQPITMGVDAGSKNIGISASTEKEELYSAEAELRSDIVENISTRREYRRSRRNRKTRYRKAKFTNRRRSEKWLAPSIESKIDAHIKIVADIHKILPISKVTVEVASFDIQKIKNPEISGVEYQQGEQLDFWNAREYVLFRDNHKCQGKKAVRKKY